MARLVMQAVLMLIVLIVAPTDAYRVASSASDFYQDVANLSSFSSEFTGVDDLDDSEHDLPEIAVEVSSQIEAGRRDYYQIWAEKAHKWVGTAARRLRAGRSLLVQWFNLKKFSKAEQDRVEWQVKQRLLAMQHALENLYIEKGTECDLQKSRGGSHGTLAYVYPGQRKRSTDAYVVHVCDFATQFTGDSSTQTLVHEISHHKGTTDHAYGKNACLKLTSGEAVQNADSYSWFVYQLIRQKRKDGKPLYEEGSGKPHSACNTACDASSWEYEVGKSLDLAKMLPLGQCLDCSWKAKTSGVAGLANWMSGTMAVEGEDICGDGEPAPRKVEAGDCDKEGCEWIDLDSQCLEAAQSLGLSFSDITRGKRARSNSKPFGCWASLDTLYLNSDRRSRADASPSEAMICMCPTQKEYGQTYTARACCMPYECQRP